VHDEGRKDQRVSPPESDPIVGPVATTASVPPPSRSPATNPTTTDILRRLIAPLTRRDVAALVKRSATGIALIQVEAMRPVLYENPMVQEFIGGGLDCQYRNS
jgi:hypothetical protein